jgi:hypothetical protein
MFELGDAKALVLGPDPGSFTEDQFSYVPSIKVEAVDCTTSQDQPGKLEGDLVTCDPI